MSHHKCIFQKINNSSPTRENPFKNRAQSIVHFQINGTERRSIHWLIDSWRDIGRRGRGSEGANFEGRELDVEEEERM
jgi:hypothetical protein